MPINCSGCDRLFTRQSDLSRHERKCAEVCARRVLIQRQLRKQFREQRRARKAREHRPRHEFEQGSSDQTNHDSTEAIDEGCAVDVSIFTMTSLVWYLIY
jgi:hypothetical protein